MLPRPHKLTSSADFKTAMKQGVRAGSRTLMVHVYPRPDEVITGGPRFGLVVSKQVGNAVTRHAVSRKLRHVVVQRGVVDKLPRNYDVVIRALPKSATATSDDLARDMERAITKAMNR
ncbi:ribonuclease P protein component [Corynebacterium sp. HMSC067D03]|uniref:Ribonuclease P protein component n=1 Tax=Corynebacterium coyleae TaxID=53374 RepID=A0AAP6XMN6_9CORY|nr:MULTISPECIES: ribonuclease P protein component [Corynebacterium]MDK8823388.1 ribonuclease P protein component [Corynebacterium coyleae]NJJ04110.1 ribonuclease P protein component [Corynebacterium coyleae]OFL18540.1 ribonuclease P protein component [Corynebacterium sp. HMSC067D03]OFL93689.1 ribonuclease P protein component [Corynebacterium sp. HMSC055D05]OHO27249.1 ribonuclease P protein component [Corynebacterium sp. HMSC034B08]